VAAVANNNGDESQEGEDPGNEENNPWMRLHQMATILALEPMPIENVWHLRIPDKAIAD
jgi:hypothetical protein